MARSRRFGAGRGTHMGKGVLSGSSLATIPSGVTIVPGGIEISAGTFLTPTELGYLNTAAGNLNSVDGIPIGHPSTAGRLTSGGSIVWAGTSVAIDTGLSSVMAFVAMMGVTTPSSASAVESEWVSTNLDRSGGGVTAGLFANNGAGVKTAYASGCSLTWVAFGI